MLDQATGTTQSLPIPPRTELKGSLGAGVATALTPSTGAVSRLNCSENSLEATSGQAPPGSPSSEPRFWPCSQHPAPSTDSLVEDPMERVPILGAESEHQPNSWPHTCPPAATNRLETPHTGAWGLACRREQAGTGRAIWAGSRTPEHPRHPPASLPCGGARPIPAPKRRLMFAHLLIPLCPSHRAEAS